MATRNNELTKAALVTAALDVIEKKRLNFTMLDVTKRAKLSEGIVYHYFPDKDELIAAACAQVLASDLAQLQADDLGDGLRAWVRGLAANYPLRSVIGTLPLYREGIKRELQRKLRAADADSGAMTVSVVYGAAFEAAGTLKPRDETALLAVLLRACGLKVRA